MGSRAEVVEQAGPEEVGGSDGTEVVGGRQRRSRAEQWLTNEVQF